MWQMDVCELKEWQKNLDILCFFKSLARIFMDKKSICK